MIKVSSTVNDHVKEQNQQQQQQKLKNGKRKKTIKNSTDYTYSTFLESWSCAFTDENIRSIVDIKELDSYNALGYFEVKMRLATFFSHHNPPKQCQIRLLTRKDQILHIWLAIQVQVRH